MLEILEVLYFLVLIIEKKLTFALLEILVDKFFIIMVIFSSEEIDRE
jgi:hypothetical protein